MQAVEVNREIGVGVVTETSWQAPPNMSYEEWEAVGQTLQTIQGSINWWVGDWLNEGEKRYGETYAQAIEVTGWDIDRLRKCKYVSSRVQNGTRVPFLSWTAHREVAHLSPDQQEHWLNRAQLNGWSSRQLRDAIRASQQVQPVNGNGHASPPPIEHDYLTDLASAEGPGSDVPGSYEESYEPWTPPARNGRDLSVHFSSERDAWETPQDLFTALDAEFDFTLDVCALPDNAKCNTYFTPEDDGLTADWRGHICWMNPPYGTVIKQWMQCAYEWFVSHQVPTVCLVPARVDTGWWWDYATQGEIRFLKGRLVFGSDAYWQWVWEQPTLNGKPNPLYQQYGKKNSAPFPSAVIVFHPDYPPTVRWWDDWRSHVPPTTTIEARAQG